MRDSFGFEKKLSTWRGFIEKTNPFLKALESKDQESKTLRKSLVNLEEQAFEKAPPKSEMIKTESFFHPLALQTLELRAYMQCPLPERQEVINFFLEKWVSKTQTDLREQASLKGQTGLGDQTSSKTQANLTDQKAGSKNQTERPDSPQEVGTLREEAKNFFKDTLDPLKILQEKDKEIQKLQESWKQIQSLGLTKEQLVSKAKTVEIGLSQKKTACRLFPDRGSQNPLPTVGCFVIKDRQWPFGFKRLLSGKASHPC